jgi:hypothetical protein
VGVRLIGYDLDRPGQNYDGIQKEIKGLGAWWHYLDSTWLVDTSLTVQQVSDRLKAVMDDDDKLLVLNIAGDAYAGWLPPEAWEWIKEHM